MRGVLRRSYVMPTRAMARTCMLYFARCGMITRLGRCRLFSWFECTRIRLKSVAFLLYVVALFFWPRAKSRKLLVFGWKRKYGNVLFLLKNMTLFFFLKSRKSNGIVFLQNSENLNQYIKQNLKQSQKHKKISRTRFFLFWDFVLSRNPGFSHLLYRFQNNSCK